MVNLEKLPPPSELMCNLLAKPEKVFLKNSNLRFSWVVNSQKNDFLQTAYQIIFSSNLYNIRKNIGNFWDSAKVKSSDSTSVRYKGRKLLSHSTYYWKARVWNSFDQVSSYSKMQKIKTGNLSDIYFTERYPLTRNQIEPVRIVNKSNRCSFIDFGKAAFGTVRITLKSPRDGYEIEVHLGEVGGKRKNTINSEPGLSRRFRKVKLKLKKGWHCYTVKIRHDKKNTGPNAIKMPMGFGEVMPFRYCEITDCPHKIDDTMVRQIAVNYPFDDNASKFISSSKILNDIWDLCKYSIKATSFCGVYVDGDRERVPYEGDAYINQLSHYCVDREFSLARYSHEYLITHPTWPMEFPIYSVFMAWQDYMYTGDNNYLKTFYKDLRAKSLHFLKCKDSLISTDPRQFSDTYKRLIHYTGQREIQPLVDWPHKGFGGSQGETDNYEFKLINTVINAYHYRAIVLMADIAKVLGKKREAENFAGRAEKIKNKFNSKFLKKSKGYYIDGVGSCHSSLHANMFALTFGLVPQKYIQAVSSFIKTRKMACSVYGAQHLLEALYQAGQADYALKLLTSRSKRSWSNMLKAGSTITTEAWDNEYKTNQDWNHAWGAAPANIIPRFLMGIQPTEPGFRRIRIKPQPGELKWADIKLPTIRGSIYVNFERKKDFFNLNVSTPANTVADIFLPRIPGSENALIVNGQKRKAKLNGRFLRIDDMGSGCHAFEMSLKR